MQPASPPDDKPVAAGNLQPVLDGLRTDMRKAARDTLNFEEVASSVNEVKRLKPARSPIGR